MDLTNWTILFACGTALAGIGTGFYLMFWVMRLSPGSDRMQQIALAIQEGAKAYLNRQYRTVGVVAVVLFILLWAAGSISDRFGLLSAIGFLVVALASATA